MDGNYLAHHGIKGQKWGERKYQYQDGSLTPEGRRHYGYGEERSSMRAQIKIMRQKAKDERKMVREKARADRLMEKQINKQREKKEKEQQKQQLKLQKIKNAEKEKRAKEFEKRNAERAKQKAIEKEEQIKRMAEFKKQHPLQYRRLKKYLTADGTLNEAGQALYFGNGKKKNIYQMSNEDLKKTTDRLYLEKNYKDAVYKLKEQDSHGAKAKALELLKNGGIAFAGRFAGNTLSSLVTSGPDGVKNDMLDNGKQALEGSLEAMGTTLTRQLGLVGKKGNPSYNAFRDSIHLISDEEKARKEGTADARKVVLNMIKEDTKNNLINTYKTSNMEKSYRNGYKIKDTFMSDYKRTSRTQRAKDFSSTFAKLDTQKLSDKELNDYIEYLDRLMDQAYK